MAMPTDMKNRPSSSPLNGSISVSMVRRYSELARTTPAMNAPSVGDTPMPSIRTVTPMTMASEVAVNTSRRFDLAMA